MFIPRWSILAAAAACGFLLVSSTLRATHLLLTPRHSVLGAVWVNDAPAPGAEVWLYPLRAEQAPGRPLASGVADESGQVRPHLLGVTSGVPAGDYAVTIRWRPPVVQGEDWVLGPNRIPARFGDPQRTPLKISVPQQERARLEWRLQGCNCQDD